MKNASWRRTTPAAAGLFTPLPSRGRIPRPARRWLTPGCLSCLGAVASLLGAGVDLFSVQPPSLSSVNGTLNVDLVIKTATVSINGHQVDALRTYNGTFPGPTLRVRPGDTLNIRYINRLPADPMAGMQMGALHMSQNNINLHTHGLNVSPEAFADNVLLEIQPGEWIPYQIAIPADHPAGLFWYHPHMHGAVNTHLGSGLAGNLIIGGGEGDLDQVPEVKAAKTLQLLLQQIQIAPTDAQKQHFAVPESPIDTLTPAVVPDLFNIYTLNGVPSHEVEASTVSTNNHFLTLPEIHLRPGEVQRWQFTHAGLDKFMWLTITNDVAGAVLPMYLLSYDGITLPAMETRDSIFVSPANRFEVLVKGGAVGTNTFAGIAKPKAGSNYDSVWTNVFFQIPYIPLAKVIVAGDPMDMPLPTALNPPTNRLANIRDSEITRRREISLDMSLPPQLGGTNGEAFDFTMDYKIFDPNRVDQTMLLDTAEEWTVRTTDEHSGHPLHIHVNWFQVTEVNGVPLPYPRWQDTVAVPKGETVKIRHRFKNYTGKFVMHCHIVRHEDAGMMALMEIVDPPHYIYPGADGEDPERDGYVNLFHTAFGFVPNFRSVIPDGFPIFGTANAGGQNYLSVKFSRRTDRAAAALQYLVESSSDLVNWHPVTTLAGDSTTKANGFQAVTIRDDTPMTGPGAGKMHFLRMGVARTSYKAMPIPAGFPQ